MEKVQHWGELAPPVVDTDSGIAAIERAEITKPKPLQIHGARIVSSKPQEIKKITVPSGNPVMIQTIKLQQFLQKSDSGLKFEDIPKLISPPSYKFESHVELEDQSVRELLKRAIILIAVHNEFDTTTESVIDILVDVAGHYLQKMTSLLRNAVDTSALRSSNDFVDVFDRVFHQMAIPNVAAIKQYDYELQAYNYKLLKEVFNKVAKEGKQQPATTTFDSLLLPSPGIRMSVESSVSESIATDNTSEIQTIVATPIRVNKYFEEKHNLSDFS